MKRCTLAFVFFAFCPIFAQTTKVLYADQYPSISAAIAALPTSGGQVFIDCGTYLDNIVLTKGAVKLQGAGVGCVNIEPANTSLPVLTIDATNSGPGGFQDDELSDVTLVCPSATACADGVKIMGGANQPNDWHKISRVRVTSTGAGSSSNGFLYGVEIAGRTIWSVFQNVEVVDCRADGWHIASSSVFNFNVFRDSRSAYNQNYGVYVNNTYSVATAENNTWDRFNAEYNGANTGLTNCAGFYATGMGGGNNILNSTFEGNCASNSDSAHVAHIRLSGTYNQGWTIKGNQFNSPYNEWSIYNDTNWTGGEYSGNYVLGGRSFYIATWNSSSQLSIGTNNLQGPAAPTVVTDSNGLTHVTMLSPSGLVNAHTGTRYVCIDIHGTLLSQPTPCSGT